MDEKPVSVTGAAEPPTRRCPVCDSVMAPESRQCLMCGSRLEPAVFSPPLPTPLPTSPSAVAVTVVSSPPEPPVIAAKTAVPDTGPSLLSPEPATATAVPDSPPLLLRPRRRQSPLITGTTLLTLLFCLITGTLGALILRFQEPASATGLFPTASPIPPTPTLTPTWTPIPTETPRPSTTPTLTVTPAPTDTPPPPIPHQVASGETLIGLSLRYRVSIESIATVNGFNPATPIQAGQTLLIPWPTPTPTVAPVAIEVNGEVIIADPEGCERYQVQVGDSLSGVAARYDIDFSLFMQVNRLTEAYILQPGDTLCIPHIIFGGSLPPTPGPSPTPSPTAPLPGPYLLYPAAQAVIDPPDGLLTLLWTAVKDLQPDEWYMVELRDLDMVGGPAHRGFTRDNSFQVPGDWRPDLPATHLFRWRVSLVKVTGTRSDGGLIYTYAGEESQEELFYWLGAVPTPTPTPTSTPTLTPTPPSP